MRRRLAWLVLRLATGGRYQRVIVQNEDDQTAASEAGIGHPNRLRLVRGSGVDTARFCPGPTDTPFRVVLASRMLRSKGVADFVVAAEQLKPRFPQVRFLLVGDVDQANRDSFTRSDLLGWRNQGAIEWQGHSDAMESILKGAALVCLPTSYGEGIPKILLEAASCGLPLVATDVPGCREIVRPSENGFLVPPGDPEALVPRPEGSSVFPAGISEVFAP